MGERVENEANKSHFSVLIELLKGLKAHNKQNPADTPIPPFKKNLPLALVQMINDLMSQATF